MQHSLYQEFIHQAIFRLEENPPRIKNCLDRLTESQVWQKPNPSSNSIGNLIVHLCGNITQYIHASLGNTPDQRNRDEEFSISGGLNKETLLKKINVVIEKAVNIIKACPKENLLRSRIVQGFEMSGLAIILHVVEHLTYHVGQIAYATKILKNEDLGFYADMDLNIKNEDL